MLEMEMLLAVQSMMQFSGIFRCISVAAVLFSIIIQIGHEN
jgi:hypothetical protein